MSATPEKIAEYDKKWEQAVANFNSNDFSKYIILSVFLHTLLIVKSIKSRHLLVKVTYWPILFAIQFFLTLGINNHCHFLVMKIIQQKLAAKEKLFSSTVN